MTIPLPPLPEPDFALDQGDEPCYYAHTIRAIQREAMRVAIEAAAKACESESLYRDSRERCPWPGDSNPFIQGHKSVTARNLELAIRALEIGT